MNTRHVTYVIVLALSVVVPFVYVSQGIYQPKRDAWESTAAARERNTSSRSGELAVRVEAADRRIAEASREVAALQPSSAAAARKLRSILAQADDIDGTLQRLRGAKTLLTDQIHEMERRNAADEDAARAVEVANAALAAEIAELQSGLRTVDEELRSTSAETSRLGGDRLAWEARETYESVPRGSAQGVVGWYGDALCGGVGLDLWVLRPWGQRLGLKSVFLVDEKYAQEVGFAALSWQKLVTRRMHFDVWAGPHWSALSSQPSATIDPALGISLGATLPKFRLGFGVMAMASPDETLVGASVGYSQVGEAIDVYRRR